MGIKDMIDRLKNQDTEDVKAKDEEMEARWGTRDRVLAMLRRNHQAHLDEMEKTKLKQVILDYEKKRNQEQLWGIKSKKLDHLKKMKIEKQKEILKCGYNLLGSGKKRKFQQKKCSMIGKGLL